MGAQGTPPGRNRERTRGAILTATSQLIAEKGVDGFAISDIAVRAKVNRALIYHYFKNRDNLLLETVRFITHKYEEMNDSAGADSLERSFRMHIAHPEVSRFLLHYLLNGRPLPGMSTRLLERIAALERLKEAGAVDASIDPTFVIISGWLVQISWSFAREEIARLFDMTVEDADERLIAQMRKSAQLATGGQLPPGQTS